MIALELYRRLWGLSQWDVAHIVGIDQSRIHHYEQGRPIPPEIAQAIAAHFGVPPGELSYPVTLDEVKQALRATPRRLKEKARGQPTQPV